MAAKKVGFIDLHIEKLAVGLGVLLTGGLCYYSLAGGRFAVNDRGPSELCRLAGEIAEQTSRSFVSAPPRPEATAEGAAAGKDPVAQLQAWFGPKSKGLIQVAEVGERLPRTQRFPPILRLSTKTAPEDRRSLAKLVTPGIPIVSTGRSSLRFLSSKPSLRDYDGRLATSGARLALKSWVSVAAQVDLVEQEANFIAERYPSGAYLALVKVQMQRKDVDNPTAGWEEVATYLPYEEPARPTVVSRNGRFSVEGLDTYREIIDGAAEHVARPRLPAERLDLPQVPFLDEPPDAAPGSSAEQIVRSRVKKWIARARDAMEGRRPFKAQDLDAAYVIIRAAVATAASSSGVDERDANTARQLLDELTRRLRRSRGNDLKEVPRSPERLMPILAHDLTAQVGRTYVYRLRYEALNIYAGNPGELKSPSDAAKLTILSEWSPPSRPVEIEGDTYLFLTKADKARGDVTVVVFKAGKRGSARQEYRIRVGSEIGRKERTGQRIDFTTGLVCVDIDFDRMVHGKKDVAMIYVDTSDGALNERLLSQDRKDKLFKRLSEARTAGR